MVNPQRDVAEARRHFASCIKSGNQLQHKLTDFRNLNVREMSRQSLQALAHSTECQRRKGRPYPAYL